MVAAHDVSGERVLRRDAQENREKILAAAAQLMAERGLDVGHDQVARVAGVAVGTVYRRFPDRASLVAALYGSQVEHTVAAAQAAIEEEDPWSAVVGFLTAVSWRLTNSRGLRELSAGSPHGRELTKVARERIGPLVERLVDRAHEAGVLRPDITERDLALVPMMVGAVIDATRGSTPDTWQRALAVVLDGMHAAQPDLLAAPEPTEEAIRRILGHGLTGDGSTSAAESTASRNRL